MSTTTTPQRDALDLLTAAQATIPTRARIADALADAERHRREVPDGPDPASVAQSAVADLLDGKPVDLTALGARAADLVHETERVDLQRAQLDRIVETLRNRLERVDRDGIDAALAHLDAVLADLVDEARTVLADLAGVSTAEQAIDAGRGVQWRLAGQIAEQIVEVRHAQTDLVDPAHGDPSTADAAVRLWGSLAFPDRAVAPDVLVDLERQHRDEGRRPDPAWADATVPALRLLVEGRGEPRVATLAQMRATARRVRDLATGAPTGRRNVIAHDTPGWSDAVPAPSDPADHPAPAGVMRGQMLGGGSVDSWDGPGRRGG